MAASCFSGTLQPSAASLEYPFPRRTGPSPHLPSPHKEDLALGPGGLVPLRLSCQLFCSLFQQLHIIHAALPRSQVRHWRCRANEGEKVKVRPQALSITHQISPR